MNRNSLAGMDQTVVRTIRRAALVVAVAAALPAIALAQEQTTTRVATYDYDTTTGLLKSETADSGLSHCVETQYEHDNYGNRRRVLVQSCASTIAAASFEPRLTLNEFGAKTDGPSHLRYPAGAFQTRSRTGRLAMEAGSEPPATEATADHHPGFGMTLVQTAVAHRDNARSISVRTEPDGFGRPLREYAPVKREADGTVIENYAEYRTVYCQGSKVSGSPDPSCISYQGGASVPIDYASGMLVNQAGNRVASVVPQVISAYFIEVTPKSGTETIGARSRVHYDSLHREIAKETEAYSGQWSMTLTAYDTLGMSVASWGTYFGRTASGSFVAPPDELRQWTVTRDLLHRPTEQKQSWRGESGQALAAERRAQISYNGLESRATVPGDSSPDGQPRTSITYKYASGQTAQTIDAYGATLNSAYDAVGNLIETVDALGNRTTIGYTAGTARFKTSMTDPNQGTWFYTYNALGQLKTQTDAKGAETQMAYDVLGRLTQKLNSTQNSFWHHDKDAAGTWCASGLNRLCEATSGNNPLISRQQHKYDNLGRGIETTTTLDRAYVSQSAFDNMGRVDTVRYPTGLTLKYGYSSAGTGRVPGVLDKVFDNADINRVFWRIDTVANAADVFDARGNLRRSQLGNGVGTNNTFDPISGKVFSLEAGTGTVMQSVQHHVYTYDKANNVKTRNEKINDLRESFTYDWLNRLVGHSIQSTSDVNADRTVTVDYNAIGNILNKSDVGGYTYAATPAATGRPHAVLAAAGTSYVYDANGQLESTSGIQSRTHTWTAFNQPASMSYGLRNVSFTYDHDYKRVREVAFDGAKTRTVYFVHPDNAGSLAYEREETLAGGTTRYENRHYISVGSTVVAVVKTLGSSANPFSASVSSDASLTNYWHKDALGSVVTVSNADGTVLERMAFDPWGRRLRNTGLNDWTLESQGPAHGDRGFTGHEHLDELGLVHMNGRIYDPVLARFLSPDPIIQSPDDLQNYNRYSYVFNNPLKYTDPSGHCVGPIAAICLVAAVAMIDSGNKYWRMVGTILLAWSLGGGDGLIEQGLGNMAQLNGAAGAINLGMEASVFNGGTFLNSFMAGGIAGLAGSGGDIGEGILSGLTAGAFTVAGGAGLKPTQLVIAHAVIGCVSQAASGGKCGPGAMSSAFAKFATQRLPTSNIIVVTLVGGTASVIGGGKFANGAVTAAMGYIFNECQHTKMCGSDSSKVVARAGVAGGSLGYVSGLSSGGPSLHFGFDINDGYAVLSIDGAPSKAACFGDSCRLTVKLDDSRMLPVIWSKVLLPPAGMSDAAFANSIKGTMLRLSDSVPYSFPSNALTGRFGSGYNSNSIFSSTLQSVYGQAYMDSLYRAIPSGYQAPGYGKALPGTNP